METIPPTVIDRLYQAFATEPRPQAINACPCCVDSKEVCTLLSTPLRELTPQDLSGYASSVFLTVGAQADFRYFLPRILDILAAVSGWWPDPEVVGRALGTVPWKAFTPDERLALQEYFDAVFDSLLSAQDIDGYEIDSWLCCASHSYPPWESLLARVAENSRALVSLFDWHSDALKRGELNNGFWDDSPRKDSFQEWIRSDEIQLRLPPLLRL